MKELNEALERLHEHATYCTDFPKGDLNRVADQINALLAERDFLLVECDEKNLMLQKKDDELTSLMAIARKAKELADMERIDGLAQFKKYIILKQNVQQLISAHEQKYGPIGGE